MKIQQGLSPRAVSRAFNSTESNRIKGLVPEALIPWSLRSRGRFPRPRPVQDNQMITVREDRGAVLEIHRRHDGVGLYFARLRDEDDGDLHLFCEELERLDRKANLLDLVGDGPTQEVKVIEGKQLEAISPDRGFQRFHNAMQVRLLVGVPEIEGFSPEILPCPVNLLGSDLLFLGMCLDDLLDDPHGFHFEAEKQAWKAFKGLIGDDLKSKARLPGLRGCGDDDEFSRLKALPDDPVNGGQPR